MPFPLILAIESSCDDTSAAVLLGDRVLSNLVAGQAVHEHWGGVVPELAGRAHEKSMVPVISGALNAAKVNLVDIDAIAYTRGPGLLGSLLVGSAFAKSLSVATGKPLIEVNHMQAHIMAHFIKETDEQAVPDFPFLCLTVSGGHTQLVLVAGQADLTVIGQTIDDAAGEAFDKAAKMMGLPYPGGPLVDRHAKNGNPDKFQFPIPNAPGLNFSFSGLKTHFLYFLRDRISSEPGFVDANLSDLCASFQKTVVSSLTRNLKKAVQQTGVKDIALAGGVSANSELRLRFIELASTLGCRSFIPPLAYCTDNAAMIGIAGYYKYLAGEFGQLDSLPLASLKL